MLPIQDLKIGFNIGQCHKYVPKHLNLSKSVADTEKNILKTGT